jgi:hypothetical protein
VRTYAPQYLPDEWTTDAILRDRLRARLTEDERADAFFTKFETLFPADYNELMTQLVALYRRDGTQDQARRLGETYMRSFIDDNLPHVATADAASLTELAAALANGTRTLQQEDAMLCAITFRDGRTFALPTEAVPEQTQTAFIRITNAMLDAIASGKRAPTQYAEPTEAQWLALLERYEALGGDQRTLEAFGNGVQLPPEVLCGVAADLWTAVETAEDDFASRFVAYSMSQRGAAR